MRAASRLFGTPGGEPLNLRVFAEHPDESGCGAHECARHKLPSRPCTGNSFTAPKPSRFRGRPSRGGVRSTQAARHGLYWSPQQMSRIPGFRCVLALALCGLPSLGATIGTIVPHTAPLADIALDEARKRLYVLNATVSPPKVEIFNITTKPPSPAIGTSSIAVDPIRRSSARHADRRSREPIANGGGFPSPLGPLIHIRGSGGGATFLPHWSTISTGIPVIPPDNLDEYFRQR